MKDALITWAVVSVWALGTIAAVFFILWAVQGFLGVILLFLAVMALGAAMELVSGDAVVNTRDAADKEQG